MLKKITAILAMITIMATAAFSCENPELHLAVENIIAGGENSLILYDDGTMELDVSRIAEALMATGMTEDEAAETLIATIQGVQTYADYHRYELILIEE